MRDVPNMGFDQRDVCFGGNDCVRIAFAKGERDKRLGIVEFTFGENNPIHLRAKTCSFGKQLLCTLTVAPRASAPTKDQSRRFIGFLLAGDPCSAHTLSDEVRPR